LNKDVVKLINEERRKGKRSMFIEFVRREKKKKIT